MADPAEIPEETPEPTEAYEQLDEALDDEDVQSGHPGDGHEAARELDTELVVDETGLEELGARLDDPDDIALLDGGIDDPDPRGARSGPRPRQDPEAGWDTDPVPDADIPPVLLEDDTGPEGDVGLEIVDVDPETLENVPDDAPGADSARW